MAEFCYNHPNSKAHFKCNQCGRPICPTCLVHAAQDLCPQCAGHFPSIRHTCTNHPNQFATFTCNMCGKPLCNLDRVHMKKISGTYIFRVSTGCTMPDKCHHYKDYKAKVERYKKELQEYLNLFRGKKCYTCGAIFTRTKRFLEVPLLVKVIDFFGFSETVNPATRVWCEKCGIIIPFLSSIEEFNGLDDPKLLESAIKIVHDRKYLGKIEDTSVLVDKLKRHPAKALIIEKFAICQNAWKEALEYYKNKQPEVFIQKAFTAVENGVNALILYEFRTDELTEVPLEDKTDRLKEKGYPFGSKMEIGYWRKLRNDIIHSNVKISDNNRTVAFTFFKEFMGVLEKSAIRLDGADLTP